MNKLCLSLVVLGALAAACGGQTNGGGGGGATSDAGGSGGDSGVSMTGGDGGVTTSDAQTGDDGAGSDVYPAPHHPLPLLKFMGGPMIRDMKIVTVTYTGDTERDFLRTFDDAIVKGSWWASVTQGFGINPGTSGGYVELDPAPVDGKTLDDNTDLGPYLRQLVAAGTLPTPDDNTLYALYFPASTTITLQGQQSCQSFGAYHSSTVFTLEGGTIESAYAVIPNCGGGRTDSASHEFIEAATDAHPMTQGAWYDFTDAAWFGAAGGECADLCERGPSATDSSGNSVARSWVNAAAAASRNPCQPSDPNVIYFNAAIDTNEVALITDPNGGGQVQSGGFVSVKVGGAPKSVPIQVFSEAKLPHDLSLYVGKRARGRGTDPTQLGAISGGVTAKLSRATGRNGVTLTLTISADATAKRGDYNFIVRSVLETTNYQDWPAILRVE